MCIFILSMLAVDIGYYVFTPTYNYPPYYTDPTKTCGSMLFSENDTLHGYWQPTACGTKIPFACRTCEAYFHYSISF